MGEYNMPNDDFITRREHDEFVKRMEETDSRQNKRIEILEESVKDINRLATSIEKIATNQEFMIKEQAKQGTMLEKAQGKIESLEKAPMQDALEVSKAVKKKTIEIVVTVVVTALVVGLLMIVASNLK